MNNQEYQKRELNTFLNQKNTYFDSVAEFAESLNDMDLAEQIEWIENGSYGAGACLALQLAFNSLNNRMNKTARIGSIVLQAFYGAPFKCWNKLPEDLQGRLNDAVNNWINSEKEFAITLEGRE